MNKKYYLALNKISGVGPRTVIKLLKKWPQLEVMFALSANTLINSGLPEKLAIDIANFDFNRLEPDFIFESKGSQHIITWDDSSYPVLLKEIYDPPYILYAKGDLRHLQKDILAIVGTRKPTPMGIETAKNFASSLAIQNLTIVSGLALGIDAAAHRGALSSDKPTIAVMGTGLEQVYPYQNKKLASEIAQNGILLSELPLDTKPVARHFPRRNRIISGLSLATLVVEAAIKSGSLITARLALEQNRDVFAIPGSIHNPVSRGCHYLVQQGAKLVTSSDEILQDLNLTAKYQQNHFDLKDPGNDFIGYIGYETTTIDEMKDRTGFSVEEIACNLADLEIQGMIKAVPGGYIRCAI